MYSTSFFFQWCLCLFMFWNILIVAMVFFFFKGLMSFYEELLSTL
ncbi:hypothetical protein CLOSTHATH_00317 [Hungatella hathewayi DSM 13479]|uniref:Uncharacterized protein n=1 Tax=Hungatella hathewayi DSM 13479 TaxID=566550 RepID=D3A9P5_9FIRM|nr:hypothetical protein CLOSTHATH_00317 [Hungatella hathewayi DSM 13479]